MSEVGNHECTQCVNRPSIHRSFVGHREYGPFCRVGRCWIDGSKGLCDKFERKEAAMTDRPAKLKALHLEIEISEEEIRVAMDKIEISKKKIEELIKGE